MDTAFRDRFVSLWRRYFNGAPLPIAFYYTDVDGRAPAPPPDSPRCIIGSLGRIGQGNDLAFTPETIGCPGGRRYLGFVQAAPPNFEYFLSYGIPGRMRGERYIKTPEMVKDVMAQAPVFKAPARFIVFKRWDRLLPADEPDVVFFLATPDVLAGLFTLARFDETRRDATVTPFGSGCSTIVQHPYIERQAEHPRAVIGLFDPSARPYIPAGAVSFAAPFARFPRMVDNMEQSFLTTDSWEIIRKRIV